MNIRTYLFFIIVTTFVFGCNESEEQNNQKSSVSTQQQPDDTEEPSIPTPFDDVDCETLSTNPENCEYEICRPKEEFYKPLVLSCSLGNAEDCRLVGCYNTQAQCMKTACPPGTNVPQTTAEKTEAGFYHCKQDFDNCMLNLN